MYPSVSRQFFLCDELVHLMGWVGIPPVAYGLSSTVQQQTKERRCSHSTRKERKPKEKWKGEHKAGGIIFCFFFPFLFFLFFLCSACSCQNRWKLLPTDRVSSSFCVREFCRFYEPCKRGVRQEKEKAREWPIQQSSGFITDLVRFTGF